MSKPNESPGEATEFDLEYLKKMRARMAELVPVTGDLGLRRTCAATIDYTPGHLPLLGPLIRDGVAVKGASVAAAGGHGMMWEPGVSRAAADFVLTGSSDVVEVGELGLDRFDEDGRNSLSPIRCPAVSGTHLTGRASDERRSWPVTL